MNFAVTYQCNGRCQACFIWKKYCDEPQRVQDELNMESIKDFFTNGRYFNHLDEILLTGGEPFLRDDFPVLYRFMRETFPQTSLTITTNGIELRDDWLKDQDDVCWSILIYSLDGLKVTHDKVRRAPGNYEKVLQGIRHFRAKYPNLKIVISFTILPENYLELRDIYKLSQELRAAFTMRFAGTSSSYYENTQLEFNWTDQMLDSVDRDVDFIAKEMASERGMIKKFLNPERHFFSLMTSYERKRSRFFRCYSGIHSFFLDPYGNLFSCIFAKEPMGNVTQRPFDEIWFSAKALEQRAFIANDGCHCWSECETIPSLRNNLQYLKRMKRGE
ncbi:radical SAM protein [Acidobacteriota bacterium]